MRIVAPIPKRTEMDKKKADSQRKNVKTQKIIEQQEPKNQYGMPILAICSLTRSLLFPQWHTHIHTTDGHSNLETESDQWDDSVKTLHP